MKRMGLLLLTAIALTASIFSAPATAAPKAVAVKKLERIATGLNAEGLLLSGKTIITYSNTEGANSNIVLTGHDLNGVQVWQKIIDSGVDEIATTGATDGAGNIWLAGSSALVQLPDTATPVVATDNPDGVVIEAPTKIRPDMLAVTIWKFSASGEQLSRFTSTQSSPAFVSAISLNTSGISLVGVIADQSFVLNSSSTGLFTKPVVIGTSKTTLNAVVRSGDGTISVFGSSSETLGGKKLAGSRDGVLIKLSKTLKITSVVRSSAAKADRSWLSADSSLALTGSIRVGKTTESAITKFTSTFAPSWTQRVTSNGTSLISSTASGKSSTTYVALGSTGVVAGINGWRPTSLSTLLLVIDGKGVTTAALGAVGAGAPIALASSKDVGVVALVKAEDQSISIFRLAI